MAHIGQRLGEDGQSQIVDPSGYIRPEYVVQNVLTTDERKLSGIAKEVGESIELTNWVDNKNNMVTKLEVTPGHPGGMLAVGDQINGQIHSTLCKVERLGLVNGVAYRLSVTRTGDIVTGSVTSLADGSVIASCSAMLSAEALSAFGAGTGQGLRVKIKDDEDDGGSRWDNFAVFTN